MSSRASSRNSMSDGSSRRSTPLRGNASRRGSRGPTPQKDKNPPPVFESYASLKEVQNGLKRGEVIEVSEFMRFS